ncbi:AAA family ATPase [Vibrio splendidus]|uniref:AAA family ATPase n=1 Tax=Vibrio splendidus TaxID=29497 RepID=UPI002469907A|nr:AAA family ATPase [Vibrio splendidus]MDH5937489.1 AAA family ATPase [Vibrio splendidus]
MSKIYKFESLYKLAQRFRDDLNNKNFVLFFAYNGTGKTRLSMEFKEQGKKDVARDTLYFNAYTEDLFHWDNDLENDAQRVLTINSDSKFFDGFKELALEDKIFPYLERYADFDFKIDYESWTISFSKGDSEHIKISRGEENIFVWCIFLAICELTIDDSTAYNWVKYIYIDDPISSLDDNNVIAIASDLAKLLKKGLVGEEKDKIKTVLSSHHSLFFNVMCNELKKMPHKQYFLHRSEGAGVYSLRATDDTPYFHHVALLSELQQATESDKIYTHHFNAMRSILEKTATFFGFKDFSACLHGIEDEALFTRALNLLSHGKYSVYNPVEMGEDNKKLFKKIFSEFLQRYQFDLPEILTDPNEEANPS